MAGDKKAWSKKIQEDKAFAKGYKGLTSVKAILKKAKEDGYNVTEAEITKEDLKALEAVAGGYNNNLPGMGALQNMGGNDPNGQSASGQVAVAATQTTNVTVTKQNVNQSISATDSATVGNQTSISYNAGK